MDGSPPGFSVLGISQARILEWVAISFSRESSWPRDRTWVSCIGRWILYHGDTFSLVTQLCLTQSPWTAAHQASLSITNSRSLLKLTSIELVMPYNNLVLCRPLLLLPSVFSSIRVISKESVSSLHQVAKLLELQHQSFQWIFRTDILYDWLVWSPCNPRYSQESSPAPQFKGISSLVLSLLYGPTLTSTHDSWKTHSFD